MLVSLLLILLKPAQPRVDTVRPWCGTCRILMSLIKATEQSQMLFLWPTRPWWPTEPPVSSHYWPSTYSRQGHLSNWKIWNLKVKFVICDFSDTNVIGKRFSEYLSCFSLEYVLSVSVQPLPCAVWADIAVSVFYCCGDWVELGKETEEGD